MVETVITITLADLAALDSWERDKACDAIAQIWRKRAEQFRPAEPTTFTDLSEPVLTPEPVEAPREVPATPPAGAPGERPEGANNMPADLPKPAADYSADIPDGSDPSTSDDVPKAEPAGLATTMTPDETARWEAAMKAGVRVTDDGPPPAEVDDTPVPPAHKGGGGYERYHVECEDCGKKFGRGAGMAAHKRAAHSGEPQRGEPVGKSNVTLDSRPPKPLPGERWAYTCDNCQRTFPGERTLEEHERTCGRKAS